ncbi:hypothetical protein RHMOL_Rhmol11G0114600 [Rhododendron molle]|nr:hypothetical protein RHMOL_Rhmol11G0114600 [Rhododendron molle]
MKRNHQQLKEKVRKQLVEAKGEPSQQLELIDAIQRLGVAYHFETKILKILHHIYETDRQSAQKNVNNDHEDLYTTALSFRLLRQQGYPVSCGKSPLCLLMLWKVIFFRLREITLLPPSQIVDRVSF